ncbi:hypothetical protein BJF83_14120 [Nocardiopsis sp. CNR-923]|nr:hypothetical protein BJF83_14120 [Nocardiopsis sp. CNR-923]
MAWHVSDDHAQYRAAERLHERHRRLWWVMWAPAARRYFAFYQGDADVEPIRAASPEELERGIRRAQATISRTHPASYWRCPVAGCAWTSVNAVFHSPCPRPPAARH